MSKYRVIDRDTGEVLLPDEFSDVVEAIKASGKFRTRNATWEEVPEEEGNDTHQN